ncbi:hypothetical protein [Nannocystis punicea]|uniref:Lipoprotein n=1 Tax=Nannocystis punicea TaxID=2995304 RepID=A0ABY7H5H7_9BACT|nr:hypothetical protein [Nannocystis poenicansa]WAS94367.1 hypothetical protein O0S08_50245 [Nannocystis poenicansa]
MLVARRRLIAALTRAALAFSVGLAGGCYSNEYLDGLCANTGVCPDPPPESPVAFRITSLELVDPHTYTFDTVLGVCTDSTATLNGFIAQGIADYDVSNVLVLRPLDPKSAVVKLQYVSALCIAGEPTNCTDRMVAGTHTVDADAFNRDVGACGGTEANSLNQSYDAPPQPAAPCLVSETIPGTPVRLAAQTGMLPLDLNLVEVEIAAAYAVDGEPQKLVQGALRGFMPAATAMLAAGQANGISFVPWNVLAGGAGCQVDAMNTFSDIDNHGLYGQGVWMYFNFTAERVQWATDRPEPMPETGGASETDGTSTTAATTSATGEATAATAGPTVGPTVGTGQ